MTDTQLAVATSQSAGELVARGDQLLTIRTEKQLLVAVQRPRDEDRFEVKLKAEAASAGEDFFYSIPYKDHVDGCQDRRTCRCPSKPVEGPGVGLARSAARLWGNCNVDTCIEQDLPDAWIVGAWFVDFETNYTKHEVKRVSKMKVLKGGRVVRAADRELDVEYQKGASKVERDVILRSLPRHVIEKAFELAKLAAVQEKSPINEQIARIVRKFGSPEVGVSIGRLEKYIGCAFNEDAMYKAEKSPREVCAHLRGLITAIAGGETDVDEVFGPIESPVSQPASSSGLTASDIAKPAVEKSSAVEVPAAEPVATAAEPATATEEVSLAGFSSYRERLAAYLVTSGASTMRDMITFVNKACNTNFQGITQISEDSFKEAVKKIPTGGERTF